VTTIGGQNVAPASCQGALVQATLRRFVNRSLNLPI